MKSYCKFDKRIDEEGEKKSLFTFFTSKIACKSTKTERPIVFPVNTSPSNGLSKSILPLQPFCEGNMLRLNVSERTHVTQGTLCT